MDREGPLCGLYPIDTVPTAVQSTIRASRGCSSEENQDARLFLPIRLDEDCPVFASGDSVGTFEHPMNQTLVIQRVSVL